MNYLAHAYLSFGHSGVLIGNMISDFVKGKKKFDYPEAIQTGINFHRQIDHFTDTHPATHLAKDIFRPAYRLYSASFVDVVYDHFLANDKTIFTDKSLEEFSERTYDTLDKYTHYFPEKFAMMYPYMKSHNWLNNYQFSWGIQKSLAGVARRAKYIDESDTAFYLLNEHYETLKQLYNSFFPQVRAMAEEFCNSLPDEQTIIP